MLPSERTRTLAKKATLVGVRKADPACEALRKEFDGRATGWVVVLDPRGEVLDSGAADPKGALKKKDSGFPDLFADRVEKSLERKESLQDLERRWAKDPLQEAAFEPLAARLEEFTSDRRLRELCSKLAALPGLPGDRRAAALFRGFAAGSREYGSLDTPEARARYALEGEGLIADHAAHPKAPEALQALFQGGYAGQFDVPAKSAAGIARLKARAELVADPGPLRGLIEKLVAIRDQEIARLEAGRARSKGNEGSEAWYAGALGDAEMTVRVLSKAPHDQHAFFQAMVREAREKMRAQERSEPR